jgi:hypothetical protein
MVSTKTAALAQGVSVITNPLAGRSKTHTEFRRTIALPRCDGAGFYSQPVTVWVYVAQYLGSDHRCRAAAARLIRWRLAQ